MSLRSQLKVPRYGLFYFESDSTVSIVPLRKISKVLKGDNTSVGSIVEVSYGGLNLKAEIVAVHDNENELKQKEIDFVCDPTNSHRFPEEVPEEAEEVELIVKSGKKRKEHEGTNEKNPALAMSISKPETKKHKKEEKEKATVFARFQPGTCSSPQQQQTTPKSSVIVENSPTFIPSPISSLLSFSSPAPSTPERKTPKSLQADHRGSTSTSSNGHVARRLEETYHVHEEIPSAQVSQMLWVLARLEQKVDNIVSRVTSLDEKLIHLETSPASSQAKYSPAAVSEDALPDDVSVMAATDSESLRLSNCTFDNDVLMQLKNQASSAGNFAVRLIRHMFDTSELVGHNVSGVRGKKQLDKVRVNKTMELVYQFFPCAPGDRFLVERSCRKAIDAYLRSVK